MKKAVMMAILILMTFAISGWAGDFVVLDGAKQAVIVFNPADGAYKANVQTVRFELKAHEDLANYLEKATGKKFTMVPDAEFKADKGSLVIYVGNCKATQKAIGKKLAKLDRDGFIVKVEPKQVFLAGPMIHSTCWAVQQFLFDNLGVRWLFPGELGTDVPKTDKVIVKTGEKIEQPIILGRLWSGTQDAPGGIEWSFRQRIFFKDTTGNILKGRYEFHHNMSVIFPIDKYFDEHPDYYAIVKGKREKGGFMRGANICYSNPDTAKVAAQAAIDYFKANPEAESFSFGPDDAANWCECGNCRKLFMDEKIWRKPDPKDELMYAWSGDMRASALYWSWLSKVAAAILKECPGKKIGTLAYDGYTCPPIVNPEIKVNPEIMPFMCLTQADLWQADNHKQVYWLIDEWAKRVKSWGLYDYAYGGGMVLPRIYTPLVQQTVKDGLPKGLKGCYAEVYPNWGTDGPRLYQTAKIWWNPNVDLNADLKDWCEHAFKEAAAPMEKHFRKCGEEWASTKQDKYNSRKRPGGIGPFGKPYQFSTGWRTTPFEIFTPEVIAEHTAFFDEAAKLAKDETVKKRIAWYRNCWDTSVMFAEAYWAGEGLETYIARGITVEQAATALKKMPASYKEEDWKKIADERMDNDAVAWNPNLKKRPTNLKWMMLSNPVRDSDLGWCAKQIVDEKKSYYKEHMLSTPPIEEAVKTEIKELFEKGMENSNANYKQAVEKIYKMADGELKKAS